MKKYFLIFMMMAFWTLPLTAKEHPSLFINKPEALELKQNINKYPLLKKTYDGLKKEIDHTITQPIETPPPGEGGGYAHEKHKQN